MGWKFQKRIRLLPAVTLNLSRKGISTSFGTRGARVTLGHGKRHTTLDMPGSGISYTNVASTKAARLSAAPQDRAGRWLQLVLIAVAIFIVALLSGIKEARAINKCTGADGKVTYQEVACPANAKGDQPIKTWENSARSNGSMPSGWKFERKHDDMTGQVSCLVMSPITFPKTPQPPKFIPVHMVMVVSSGSETIALRTSDNSNLFHNDLSGMGVKTDTGQFTPFSVKAGSHVVGIGSSEALISALENSKNLLVRARFWPYEQLYDMEPIPSAGFGSALKQGRVCAGSEKGQS
ncbi:MAG: DUF4236 domain-containing protein [Burkholderiaceae bacterium]|nr:DUF4236 domain-containing protein [Burkholderiaceae bacterium]MBY0454735.1 DUF4236 domain-containing protein [Burkholderiaceae bacterium]